MDSRSKLIECMDEIENGMCSVSEKRDIWQNDLIWWMCKAINLLIENNIKNINNVETNKRWNEMLQKSEEHLKKEFINNEKKIVYAKERNDNTAIENLNNKKEILLFLLGYIGFEYVNN